MWRAASQQKSVTSFLRQAILFVALPLILHTVCLRPAEPVFEGDSNRHVVTSIFFHDYFCDAVTDGTLENPKRYAERYYDQYPALGLLVWPPMFHGVCGLAMIAFGTSVTVARVVVLASLAVSAWCVFRIASRAADRSHAVLVTVLFTVLPLIFDYSRDVMLEVPTLAFILISVDQFDVWFRSGRLRSLYLSAITAGFAALTRFDAAVLLPFYLMMFILGGGWDRLVSRHVVAAAVTGLLIVAPIYMVILKETGDLHVRQAAVSVGGSEDGTTNGFLAPKNLLYYPKSVVSQAGWIVSLVCVPGILLSLTRRYCGHSTVFVALLAATYVTFSPLAELRSRHAIYWTPAISFFAVAGVNLLIQSILSLRIAAIFRHMKTPISVVAYSLLLVSASFGSMSLATFRVEGYSKAASLVLKSSSAGDRVFFDGWWDGNFIYHMRHLDSSRSRYVLRGDRLLYDFLCVPSTDFRQFVANDREIMRKLVEADPELLVLENPQFYETIEIAEVLRALVTNHPDVFEPIDQIPVSSSIRHQKPFRLDVHRFHPNAARHWLEARGLTASEKQ